MKASLSNTLLLLVTIATGSSATPFERRPSLVIAPSLDNRIPEIRKKNDATERALSLRGGGVFGTPVTKGNLASFSIILWGSVGAVGLPAPEKAAEIFGFSLQEGTLGYLVYEMFGSTAIGVAVMSYLATKTSTSAAKIAMYGALSCFYTNFRAVLKGSFAKTGFMDYFGVAQLVIMGACFHGIRFGSWDATLAAKVLTVVPFLLGVIGSIDPDTAGKLMGLSKQTGVTKTVCMWFYQSLVMWGVLSWSLLSGESAYKSIGYASLSIALCIADNTFVRKANKEFALPDAISYTYLASAVIIAAGLLLD